MGSSVLAISLALHHHRQYKQACEDKDRQAIEAAMAFQAELKGQFIWPDVGAACTLFFSISHVNGCHISSTEEFMEALKLHKTHLERGMLTSRQDERPGLKIPLKKAPVYTRFFCGDSVDSLIASRLVTEKYSHTFQAVFRLRDRDASPYVKHPHASWHLFSTELDTFLASEGITVAKEGISFALAKPLLVPPVSSSLTLG